MPETMNYTRLLKDLLAVIHRDGGETTGKLGVRISAELAVKTVAELRLSRAEADTAWVELTKSKADDEHVTRAKKILFGRYDI